MSKKILFVVYHPVDPQVVIPFAKKVVESGGEVFFAIVEKENIIAKIINSHNFQYKVIGAAKSNLFGKLINSISVCLNLIKLIFKFKPTLVFSPTAPYTSLAMMIFRTPLVCWADTETATTNIKLSLYRINTLLLPDSFTSEINNSKVLRFNGYKEIAYLHPNNFSPDESVLKDLNISISDKIILMRFSALHAMHDIGLKSESLNAEDTILSFIHSIEDKYSAKVFISVTERDLDSRFDKYKLQIAPEKYTNLLAFCSLYIGEGTTTASEAGVLGVPWINIQRTTRGYLIDQQENYGLGCRIDNLNDAFAKADEYLSNPNLRQEWQLKRKELLNDKIDVSSFLSWFISEYPESRDIMKSDSNYQNIFKTK